jgi:hypothetical protein
MEPPVLAQARYQTNAIDRPKEKLLTGSTIPDPPSRRPRRAQRTYRRVSRKVERVKSAYHRHWPPRPIPDAMSRNYRMKRRGRKRGLLFLLFLLLLFTWLLDTE